MVDDFFDTIEMLSVYLRHCGYEVISARDGFSGVEMAIRFVPDVIVMDFSMPHMNGVDATRRLKQERHTRHIPVILLTGFPDRAIGARGLETGVDTLLTKPCLPEDLEGHVRRLMTRGKGHVS